MAKKSEKSATNNDAVAFREAIKQKTKQGEAPVDFITSGCTMLNLALSGRGNSGGWARGRICNVVGDGSTGKTLLALEAAAHAFYRIMKIRSKIWPDVKKVDIVYNNVETVMDFPIEKMFGQRFVDGVDWSENTPTIEEFGRKFGKRVMELKPGNFLFYVIDSWDALTSEAGKERFEDSCLKDTPEDGSYNTEKQKYGSSSFFNNICGMMEGKDVTLMIISQIRSKMDAKFGKKVYRTGGKCLDFYTHQVAWLAEIEKLKKTYAGHERVFGIRPVARVERNKVYKPYREADFTVLFDYGLDDISAMIDWYWGPKVKEIRFDGEIFKRDQLIKYIEDNDLADEIAQMCETEWLRIDEMVKPERKARFE
jgi:RecA/RadA recombinase